LEIKNKCEEKYAKCTGPNIHTGLDWILLLCGSNAGSLVQITCAFGEVNPHSTYAK